MPNQEGPAQNSPFDYLIVGMILCFVGSIISSGGMHYSHIHWWANGLAMSGGALAIVGALLAVMMSYQLFREVQPGA